MVFVFITPPEAILDKAIPGVPLFHAIALILEIDSLVQPPMRPLIKALA